MLITSACVLLLSTNAAPHSGPASCAPRESVFERRWGGIVFDVFTRNGLDVWTVEDGGRIRHTSSGDFSTPGAWTWQAPPHDVRGALRRIFFLRDGQTGWAVGDDGLVLRTFDTGNTWECLWREQGSNPSYGGATLFDVHFLDAARGWLLGLKELSISDDGGETWTPVELYEADGVTPLDLEARGVEFYAIDFLQGPDAGSGYVGLAVAEPGLVLRTSDASQGQSWTVVYDACDPAAAPLDPPAGLACSAPIGTPDTDRFEIWDVEFVPGDDPQEATAFVVGGIGKSTGYVLVGTSGGMQWEQEWHECHGDPRCDLGPGHGTSFGTLYGVTTFADGRAVACGYGGQHVRRDIEVQPALWRDESEAFPFVPGTPSHPMMGVDGSSGALGSGTAWVGGFFDTLRVSQDGGVSWTDEADGGPYRVQDVHALDSETAWIVGQFQRVARTDDGGTTWVEQNFNLASQVGLKAIALDADGMTGVAVGEILVGWPRLMVTSDGGTGGWTQVAVQPVAARGERLFEVDHVEAQSFVASGTNGLVMRTTDGGLSWESIGPDTNDLDYHSVAFDTPERGFACGEFGGVAVVHRYDAGTWTDVTPLGAGLRVLMDVAVDGARAYAVGLTALEPEEGVILSWDEASGSFAFESIPTQGYCLRDGEFDDRAGHTYKGGPGMHDGTILNDVEIAADTGSVFVGGDCGRVLRLEAGVWQELTSETSLHVYGMSFPRGSTGFLVASGRGASAISRYRAGDSARELLRR